MMDPRSETRLAGVRTGLQEVVRLAHEGMPVDGVSFVVTEGQRTAARQAELFASGASQTMNSRHLTGHAVDLMATVGGPKGGRWELNLYYKLALAMRQASAALGVPVVWGGCWEPLASLGDTEDAMAEAVAAYVARCKAAGRRPLVDGPHFELDRKVYA